MPILNEMIEDGLIKEPVTSSYIITPKGCEIVDNGGYEKYIEKKRADEQFDKEAKIASNKKVIFDVKTRWVAIISLIISILSFLQSIFNFV